MIVIFYFKLHFQEMYMYVSVHLLVFFIIYSPLVRPQNVAYLCRKINFFVCLFAVVFKTGSHYVPLIMGWPGLIQIHLALPPEG